MRESFICDTDNCIFYDENSECGCSKGAIMIQEQHCVDFEDKK